MPARKIVVADFFGTVKERGIAAYVRDFATIAEPVVSVQLLQAPHWVRRRSTAVQNILLVLHEQIVVPLHVLFSRPDLIVFPYNSCSVLLSLSPRTVCVIHDLIPYRARTRASGLAYSYVACTARWHAWLRRRFVAVSPFTARTLRALPRFRRSPIIYVPNCFSTMARVEPAGTPARSERRVTLISGIGPNKAFAEAIDLMADTLADPRLEGLAFDVVGFGPDHGRAEALIADARSSSRLLPPITVHPLLPRARLDAMLAANAVTWAHSHAEGFGRAVVEGRLAGRPVVMSRLAVFQALRDRYTFAYRNTDPSQFRQALADAVAASDTVGPYELIDQLRRDAVAGVEMLLCR
jgi:hypothetical protein